MKIRENVLIKATDEDIKDGTLIIPDNVTTISYKAFYGCTNLIRIIIPSSVTTIVTWAFEDCASLKNIVIPESIISIGAYAFDGCKNLNLKIKTSLCYIGIDTNVNIFNTTTFDVKKLTIYNYTIKDIKNLSAELNKVRKEELTDKIIAELLKNGIKKKECLRLSEHIDFINTIIHALENKSNYNYRPDFNNYIKDYIAKHKEEIINVEETLREIQNCKPNYNELKKYPYIISTLRQNIETSYSKNEETIKLKKVLSKLTKIELNNPSDFIRLLLKIFFDSDEGVIINKVSMNKLINYSKKQIKILEEQNKTFETLKEIIREYLKKEEECKTNLSVSEDDLKDLELSREEEYLNYEQITNEIDYNFSCIMQLKKITSVIIPALLNNYSLNKVILKRKEEIEILSNILNELNNFIEIKEGKSIETNNLEVLTEGKEKTYKKAIM